MYLVKHFPDVPTPDLGLPCISCSPLISASLHCYSSVWVVLPYSLVWASQVALAVKKLPANAGDITDTSSIPGWGEKISWRRKWQPTPVFLPGESHGQRSLVGYSPQGRRESDATEVT